MSSHIELSQIIRIHYGAALKEDSRIHSGMHDVFGSSGIIGRHSEALFDYPSIVIGRKGSVGLVTYAPHGGWAIDTAYFIERTNPVSCDLRYLYFALQNADLSQHTITTSIPGLSRDDIYRTRIYFPALAEQRRIAAILDKADALRRKRQEAIALTEQLLRSTFLEMFGDPVTNPKRWPTRPLGELIEAVDAGWSANGDARPCNDGEWGVLKVSAVSQGFFQRGENKAVTDDLGGRELVCPQRGDLLFSRANTRELVGATCIVEQDEPRLFLPDKLWRIKPTDLHSRAEYLKMLLSHPKVRGLLAKVATGSSGSMLNISKEKLLSTVVPAPPLSAQVRASAAYWRISDLRRQYQSASNSTEALFNSLTHRAFTGQL